MASQDLRSAVSSIVSRLKKITRIVQLVPFVYLLFYCVYLLSESFLSERALCMIDEILYISPLTTIGFLFASRILGLCIWHKAACVIHISSKIETYIDCNIFQFTEYEIIVINTCIGILTLLFIVKAYRYFFNGRKRIDTADA